MTGPPPVFWAFLGLLTGPGKLVVLGVVALLMFGRLGVLRHLAPRSLRPWLSALPWDRWRIRLSPRTALALKILAVAALAAWLLTRFTRLPSSP